MTRRHPVVTLSTVALSVILVVGVQCTAWSETAVMGSKKTAAPKCDRAQFRIILDVGHTPEVPGAKSARNALEYDFNLRLAKEIEASLIEDGFVKTTLLVTHGPAILSLLKRVAAANQLSANLFLSIHHDSVPDAYLEQWDYEGRPSHFSDRFKGYSLFVSYEHHNLKASLLFGNLLGRQLKDRGVEFASQYAKEFTGRYKHELVDPDAGVYRYDKLEVLRSTQMPAVLLEAGSIINRNEEVLMNSPEHRALIRSAVTTAVENFCDAHSPRPAIGEPATASPAVKSSGVRESR
jgi:N-acetylmuramoyl-L-alanine amidase